VCDTLRDSQRNNNACCVTHQPGPPDNFVSSWVFNYPIESKQEYQQKIDELKVKASLAKANAKNAYQEQINTLILICCNLRSKLQELKAYICKAWEDIKAELKNAWG